MTVDDRVKNSVEHKLLEGLWNELKSRYPLVLERRETRAMAIARVTKFSNGCGSFKVKVYNEIRGFSEDTANFERVGVKTSPVKVKLINAESHTR